MRKLTGLAGGFVAWNKAQVAAFEARRPTGTKARLAFALFLYTGQRRSDVVQFGRQHVGADEVLRLTQFKGRRREPYHMASPVLPALRDIIDHSPCGDLAFLVTEFGEPFTVAVFSKWFRDRFDDAGRKGLAGHGLRKAMQAIGAEDGLTCRELMAIAGHTTSKETTRYTVAAERAKMVRSGMTKLGRAASAAKVSHRKSG